MLRLDAELGGGASQNDNTIARGSSAVELPSLASGSSNPLDQWTEFHEAAAGLPESQREVFDLVWYHGLSQSEVASVQHVSVRTVKKRWNAARLAIYDALGGRLPGT